MSNATCLSVPWLTSALLLYTKEHDYTWVRSQHVRPAPGFWYVLLDTYLLSDSEPSGSAFHPLTNTAFWGQWGGFGSWMFCVGFCGLRLNSFEFVWCGRAVGRLQLQWGLQYRCNASVMSYPVTVLWNSTISVLFMWPFSALNLRNTGNTSSKNDVCPAQESKIHWLFIRFIYIYCVPWLVKPC